MLRAPDSSSRTWSLLLVFAACILFARFIVLCIEVVLEYDIHQVSADLESGEDRKALSKMDEASDAEGDEEGGEVLPVYDPVTAPEYSK